MDVTVIRLESIDNFHNVFSIYSVELMLFDLVTFLWSPEKIKQNPKFLQTSLMSISRFSLPLSFTVLYHLYILQCQFFMFFLVL